MEKTKMIKLCALWKKEKDDLVYYQGKISFDCQLLLFRNKFKEDNEKAPDLILYISETAKKKQKPEIEEEPSVEF